MDGFALRGDELAASGESTFAVAGTGLAGERFAGAVGARACVRIMTGAVMPAGLDTVVPQEFVRVDGDRVHIPAGAVQRGENLRRAGEDLARGEVALAAGRIVRPADLGLLASIGAAEVTVFRRLRVAFFSTGNELRSIGEPLDAGAVYDSNRYTLWGLLERISRTPSARRCRRYGRSVGGRPGCRSRESAHNPRAGLRRGKGMRVDAERSSSFASFPKLATRGDRTRKSPCECRS
jgi:molybdopterin biosynthesis enzyme